MTTWVTATGVLCPVGLSTVQAMHALRSGVCRKQESPFFSSRSVANVVLGAVPEGVLAPLVDEVARVPCHPPLHRRLLRLAAPALREAVHGRDVSRVPLFLAGPRPEASSPRGRARPSILRTDTLALLATQSRVPFDVDNSQTYALGHAGFFHALRDAVALLQQRGARAVLVGGVDSYADPWRLALLERAGRLQVGDVRDGFTPGEGAGFVLLETVDEDGSDDERRDARGLARLESVAIGAEAGHRESEEPYRGDGLAATFRTLFSGCASASSSPVRTTFAGWNGESFHAKEWGVATMRNRAAFDETMTVDHPAEATGDMGAAGAAVMLAVAAEGVRACHWRSPALVFAASDQAERGAALLSFERGLQSASSKISAQLTATAHGELP